MLLLLERTENPDVSVLYTDCLFIGIGITKKDKSFCIGYILLRKVQAVACAYTLSILPSAIL